MNILADFHHSTLLKSLYLTFEKRLGHTVYRPIGLDWFEQGFWKINNQEDTAKQYLGMHQIPTDGTPPLNEPLGQEEDGVHYIGAPDDWNRAITLDAFKSMHFDIIIASIPQHVEPFKELIRLYQPHAKLVIQMGNEWDMSRYTDMNILASISRRPTGANVLFYHQEFDTDIFKPVAPTPARRVYSFINILQDWPVGWEDFTKLERDLRSYGVEFRSFGGQCRDGNIDGAKALAAKMGEASLIFHVKDAGDGYGHIIHNAYACGRPIITRRSFYSGKLAEDLLVPGTYIDLDEGFAKGSLNIASLTMRLNVLEEMGNRAYARFMDVVDFKQEGEEIAEWIKHLK